MASNSSSTSNSANSKSSTSSIKNIKLDNNVTAIAPVTNYKEKQFNLKRSATLSENVITPVTRNRRALTEVPINTQQIQQPEVEKVRRDNSELTFLPLRKRRVYKDQERSRDGEEEEEEEEEAEVTKRAKLSDDSIEQVWKDLDTDEKSDICMVVEYTNDIFAHLYKRELETLPTHNYLTDYQSPYHLRPSMRAILIDWLVEVHEKFQCYPETLFLTINIMDRFLSKNKVTLSKLQLLAVTSLFIAAKFEEVNLPKLSDYAYITDGAASKNDIKNAEMFMLTSIEFNLGWPNPMNFLRRISKADGYDFQTRSIAKFLLECIMCYHQFIHLKPSLISAMSMFIAKKITFTDKSPPVWDETFKHYSGGIDPSNDAKFQSLCLDLIKEIASPTTKLDSLILKFKKPRYGAIYFKVFQWCKNQVENNKHLDTLFSL